MLKSNWARASTTRFLCLILVFLLSGILSGCSILQSLFAPLPYDGRPTVPFSEMEYTRPDVDGYLKKVQNTTKTIQENKVAYAKQLNNLNALNEGYWDYYTMYTLAYLKYAINTNDPFYSEEYVFFGETEPKINQALENLYVACSQSKHKAKFESGYFGEGFLDQYEGGGTLSNELVQLLQQEAQLIQNYGTQTANPTVLYMGQTHPLEDLLASAYTASERKNILNAYYKQANEKLGEIYTELVKVRLQISAKLGYTSYADYAYERFERDYTAQMGADFVAQVEQKLVPLYKQLTSNPNTQTPVLSSLSWREITNIVGPAVSNIDASVKEAFAFMEEYELYDVAPSSGKVQYDFTTYISAYEAPFIVMNALENQTDLFSFAHEFGHFTDMYLNYNSNAILDLSECASQGMEYLMLSYLPDTQKELRSNLTEYKMYDTLYIYITQSAYTAFEQQVYALKPQEVTLDRINAIASDVGMRFGLQDKNMMFSSEWILIPHFFEEAFYCISYCVSNDVALQIYQAECSKSGSGADLYLDLINWDLEQTFLENLDRVKLVNPCKKERVAEIAQFLQDYYDFELQAAA